MLAALILVICVTCAQIDANTVDSAKSNGIGTGLYHLQELRQNVDRIKRSWVSTPPRVYKRSASESVNTRHKRDADDLILNSLSSYCQAFKADPDISDYLEKSSKRQPLKYRDVSGFTRYHSDSNTSIKDDTYNPNSNRYRVPEPSTIPVQILAQRDDNLQKGWFIFYIAHSTTTEIARINPFTFEKKTLEMPKDSCYDRIVSKVRFSVDFNISSCKDNSVSLQDRLATFQISDDGEDRDVITLELDICALNQRNPSNSGGRSTPKTPILSEKRITSPTFILSQSFSPDNERIPFRKKVGNDDKDETTFDIQIKIQLGTTISIQLTMWDSQFNNTRQTLAHVTSMDTITYNRVEKRIIQIEYSGIEDEFDTQHRLFEVRVLNKSISSKSKLQIVLSKDLMPSHKRGVLSIGYRNAKQTGSYIINAMRLDRNFPIDLTGESRAFPEGETYFRSQTRFFCDEHGERDEHGHGVSVSNKHCMLRCEVFGRGVSTIFVTTPPSVRTAHVRSTSLIMMGKATAHVDLGPVSDELAGDYQCIIVNDKGKTKSHRMKLYTSGFVTVESVRIQNDTEKVVGVRCVVSGSDKDLDIAISVSEDREKKVRLDNVPGLYLDKNITHDQDKNLTVMSIVLPWKQVRAPRNKIHCDAKGELGKSGRVISVGWHTYNTEGIVPQIKEKLSKAERVNINSTSFYQFTCIAKGQLPIDMTFGFSVRDSALHYSDAIEEKKVVGGRTVVYTFTVPEAKVKRRGALVCRARNTFGNAWDFIYM